MTTAIAHPNIALVKYWGKQTVPGNVPATPNVSITLSQLATRTTVRDGDLDRVTLNGEITEDTKITGFLEALRAEYPLGPLEIETRNNFPTGAGLASSASGFAALITAINEHAGLGMNITARSDWARRGSASAARSLLPGFVALAGPDWQAQAIADAAYWPLHTVVAVTSESGKTISSTRGMERSRLTSPYYGTWVGTSQQDYDAAIDAIHRRDFEQLTRTAELSCLKMHSVMLTSHPALAYWNPATVACMDAVRGLRADGTPVFFTIDAGPQLKAICLPEGAERVASTLADMPGVKRVLSCGMGEGARVVPS